MTAFHVISFGFETHIESGIERRAGDRTGVALWRWNGLNSIRKASRTLGWVFFDWASLTTTGFDAEFIKESGYHEGKILIYELVVLYERYFSVQI